MKLIKKMSPTNSNLDTFVTKIVHLPQYFSSSLLNFFWFIGINLVRNCYSKGDNSRRYRKDIENNVMKWLFFAFYKKKYTVSFGWEVRNFKY
jgi:hypothetical protein